MGLVNRGYFVHCDICMKAEHDLATSKDAHEATYEALNAGWRRKCSKDTPGKLLWVCPSCLAEMKPK